jgi:sulfite exporter TauE/SafE
MFMLGLLGTGHCVGMCGPLIFAFPGRAGRFMSHAWYHLWGG